MSGFIVAKGKMLFSIVQGFVKSYSSLDLISLLPNMSRSQVLPIFVTVSLLTAATSEAAVTAFQGGDTAGGSITSTPGDFVLDLGFILPASNTTDPIIFETGGDGIGTALGLVSTTLHVFQDQNAGAEPALSLDVSSFMGQTISIRLDGDYRPVNGSRTLSLDVVPMVGAPLSASLNTITTDDDRFSGSDGTGFGGVSGALAGNGEAGSPFTGFDNTARDLAGPGSSVLMGNVLVGNLYTGGDADSQRGQAIPTAGSWSFVPEPSGATLVILGAASFLLRRRRY